MVACHGGHLKAVGLLVGLSADLTLLDNAGRAALAHANTLAAQADLTQSERKDAKAIVALLKAHGAAGRPSDLYLYHRLLDARCACSDPLSPGHPVHAFG